MEEPDVFPLCTWDCKAETALQEMCSQALLATVWALDGSIEMFRVSQSLHKPPAHQLAHHSFSQYSPASPAIGSSPQHHRRDKASRFSKKSCVGYKQVEDSEGFGGSSGLEFQPCHLSELWAKCFTSACLSELCYKD